MIEAKIDENKIECAAQGSVAQLACDVARLIGSLHLSYRRAGNAESAEVFRAVLIAALTVPDSPVWQKEAVECVSAVVPERGDAGADD